MIWRTLVRIEDVDSVEGAVTAVVHTWDHDLRIVFPLALIDNPGVRQALSGPNPNLPCRLFAHAELSAEEPQDLNLHKFEWMVPVSDRLTLSELADQGNARRIHRELIPDDEVPN